jgi:hypothetical protein
VARTEPKRGSQRVRDEPGENGRGTIRADRRSQRSGVVAEMIVVRRADGTVEAHEAVEKETPSLPILDDGPFTEAA